ncbi:MAG: S9 family peptidase, partial [Calditrichaeota bacterium]
KFHLENGEFQEIHSISPTRIDPGYISRPKSIKYPVDDAKNQVHAFFYPPVNKDYQAPNDERPPLIVMMHGGPTSATEARFNLKIQYWTSRGFAVLDVNYRGSTGFGRAYREMLNGLWGIADVEDCVEGATYLSKKGLVDNQRLIIRGSSAGGYTVLAALAFYNVFSAGTCYYGIGDLELLVKETHKFESRYLDKLIGPYPEEREKYLQRSPIHAVDQIDVPIIFFQGLEDKVVPPDQAERMVNGLKARGIPVVYMTFEEEGHGFRQAETLRQTLLAEWGFYGAVFNISLPEGIPPIKFY